MKSKKVRRKPKKIGSRKRREIELLLSERMDIPGAMKDIARACGISLARVRRIAKTIRR